MKKTKIILLVILILMLFTEISIGASNNYEVKMTLEKEKISTGEIINIPVSIENIQIKNGIVAFSSLLIFDEDIFEEPKILKVDNWSTPIVVEHLIQSTTENMQSTKENQPIMIISLKVKDTAKSGETKIKLSKFEVSDGENTIENEESMVTLNINNTQEKIINAIVDNVWFNQKNMMIAAIISIVTLFIIVFLTIYYIQHREKEEVKNILYEEVKGIKVENDKQEEEKS